MLESIWIAIRKAKPVVVAVAALVCVAAVAALSLNPHSADEEDLFQDEEWVASFEALYGQEQEAVLTSLNLEESDVVEVTNDVGLWNLQEPVSLLERDFTQSLLYDVTTGTLTLYGTRYQYDSKEETALVALMEDLLENCSELYGEPSTYPGLLNRLTNEDFAEDFTRTWELGLTDEWREEWLVGEQTLCTLSVSVIGENTGVITLQYTLYVDRNQ